MSKRGFARPGPRTFCRFRDCAGGGRSAGLRAAAPAGLAGPPMVLARECDGSGRSAVLPAVALYTLLTGEAIATLRSAFMAVVALGAMLVDRPFSLAASIAFAALVLLVQSPLALLDVSFRSRLPR